MGEARGPRTWSDEGKEDEEEDTVGGRVHLCQRISNYAIDASGPACAACVGKVADAKNEFRYESLASGASRFSPSPPRAGHPRARRAPPARSRGGGSPVGRGGRDQLQGTVQKIKTVREPKMDLVGRAIGRGRCTLRLSFETTTARAHTVPSAM